MMGIKLDIRIMKDTNFMNLYSINTGIMKDTNLMSLYSITTVIIKYMNLMNLPILDHYYYLVIRRKKMR